MKYYYVILLICISACSQKNKSANKNTIPEVRATVSKNPVASYLISMGNPKLDRKFGVEIYETPYTFKYLLVMQYDGMIQTGHT